MTTYRITAGAIDSTYEANSPEDAILAHIHDAGYSTLEEAADVCGQTVEQFLADIHVSEAA